MKRIAQLRKERGLSQIAFAMKLNITQYMVSAYESGRNQPNLEMLIQMADFFEVSIDYLLERSDCRLMLTQEEKQAETKKTARLLSLFGRLNEEQKRVALGIVECLEGYEKQ